MAIRFREDLNTLLRDLENRGYRIHSAKRIAGAPGRTADVYLENGVIVRWDAHTQTVWAEGPLLGMQRVETYLRRLYEGGRFSRFFARGFSGYGIKRPQISRAPIAGAAAGT